MEQEPITHKFHVKGKDFSKIVEAASVSIEEGILKFEIYKDEFYETVAFFKEWDYCVWLYDPSLPLE